MSSTHFTDTEHDSPAARILVVADWDFAPDAVVAACRRLHERGAATLALVVPAWLHGFDWVGDPNGSVPCARRQLDAITTRASAMGCPFDVADVGDPEPLAAVCDALAGWPADEVVICARGSRIAHPFTLARRAQRATGLPVRSVRVPVMDMSGTAPRRLLGFRRRHCVLEHPRAMRLSSM